MFKKMILATATILALGAGAVTATVEPASAYVRFGFYFGGPYYGYGYYPYYRPYCYYCYRPYYYHPHYYGYYPRYYYPYYRPRYYGYHGYGGY
jgi:hypothetical protein